MKKQQKSYQELKDTWYKKLKKSGFEDIEQDNGLLKSWESHRVLKESAKGHSVSTILQRVESKTTYFRLAGQFLYDHTFETDLDRIIWTKHAEGMSKRAISQTLKKMRFKRSPTFIQTTIMRLREAMKLRYRVQNEQE